MLNHEGSPDERNDHGHTAGNQASQERVADHLQRGDEETEATGERKGPNDGQDYVPTSGWRGWKITRWWANPYRPRGNFAEHMTVAVSIVIALIAFLQYGVYRQQKKIMESSGQQTQKLIDAANIQACAAQKIAGASDRNAAAAESFSGSATSINKQTQIAAKAMADQVAKLQAGVNETSRLATAAQNANTIAQQATEMQTRPWIGIESDPTPENVTITTWQDNPLFKFDLVLRNYGQSPAIVAGNPIFVFGDLGGKPEARRWKAVWKDDICTYHERVPPKDWRFPRPVFQGTSYTFHINASTKPEFMPGKGMLYNFLSGCIVYTGPTGGYYRARVVYAIQYSGETKTSASGSLYHPIESITRTDFDFGDPQ